jgi:hypothetical protein
MSRIQDIQSYVNGIISTIPDSQARETAAAHTFGVAQFGSLIALKRGLDPELACISGLLHDVYAYRTGSYMAHSESGADMVRVALRKMGFPDEDKKIICSAIYHHASKDLVHDDYDEILKDADVLQPFMNEGCARVSIRAQRRLDHLLEELDIPGNPHAMVFGSASSDLSSAFSRAAMADIAGKLAEKKVCGSKSDNDFLQIIQYFPEESAFDELTYAWCAAFIYHCAVSAGLYLSIRHKSAAYARFACVRAWLEWGQDNGFCFYEKDGFIPSKGDIVIYDNIIPPENKPASILWCDHTGIVLAADTAFVTVAEGNVGNMNVAGIVLRRRNEHIGCYLRIPEDYVYDGWKYDYKTGKVRLDLFGDKR